MKWFVSKQLSTSWRIAAALTGAAALFGALMAASHPYDLVHHRIDLAMVVVVACAGIAMLGAAIAGKAPI